jgi:glycosyltransferase involved in cell wall biosynthesis
VTFERIVIGIPTYKRPETLRSLLRSLAEQQLPADCECSILVVDNDPGESAREVADEFGIGLTYVAEPKPGLAHVRNAILDGASEATWLAMIDDDERPEGGWLATLLHVAREHDAAAVGGPVISEFETPPPEWIVHGGFFNRPRRPTGTSVPHVFTGNALLRVEAVQRHDIRFDDRLGLVGGEDRLFFARLHRAGGRIVWADDAICHETVSGDRVTRRWLVRRMLRVGTSTSFIELQLKPGVGTRVVLMAKGLVWWALGWLSAPASVLGRRASVAAARRRAYGTGLLQGLFGRLEAEYARD